MVWALEEIDENTNSISVSTITSFTFMSSTNLLSDGKNKRRQKQSDLKPMQKSKDLRRWRLNEHEHTCNIQFIQIHTLRQPENNGQIRFSYSFLLYVSSLLFLFPSELFAIVSGYC